MPSTTDQTHELEPFIDQLGLKLPTGRRADVGKGRAVRRKALPVPASGGPRSCRAARSRHAKRAVDEKHGSGSGASSASARQAVAGHKGPRGGGPPAAAMGGRRESTTSSRSGARRFEGELEFIPRRRHRRSSHQVRGQARGRRSRDRASSREGAQSTHGALARRGGASLVKGTCTAFGHGPSCQPAEGRAVPRSRGRSGGQGGASEGVPGRHQGESGQAIGDAAMAGRGKFVGTKPMAPAIWLVVSHRAKRGRK